MKSIGVFRDKGISAVGYVADKAFTAAKEKTPPWFDDESHHQ